MFAVVDITVAPVRLYHVCALLCYHDDRSIGVPGHDRGHNGGVDNSQSWYTVDLEGTLSVNINKYDFNVHYNRK